jgi:hypothetical protein
LFKHIVTFIQLHIQGWVVSVAQAVLMEVHKSMLGEVEEGLTEVHKL